MDYYKKYLKYKSKYLELKQTGGGPSNASFVLWVQGRVNKYVLFTVEPRRGNPKFSLPGGQLDNPTERGQTIFGAVREYVEEMGIRTREFPKIDGQDVKKRDSRGEVTGSYIPPKHEAKTHRGHHHTDIYYGRIDPSELKYNRRHVKNGETVDYVLIKLDDAKRLAMGHTVTAKNKNRSKTYRLELRKCQQKSLRQMLIDKKILG